MSPAVAALAMAEGCRLVRNPLVWLSFVPLGFWVRGAANASEAEDQLFVLIGFGIGLPGFVLAATVVMAVLRARVEHTEELLGTLAVGPDARTLGHAGSTLAAGLIGAVATVAVVIVLRPGDPLGPWWPAQDHAVDIPRPNVAQLAQGPLAIVAVGALAIAVVRWVPTWLVLAPMFVALAVQMSFAGVFHGVEADAGRWMFPLNTGVVNGAWDGCGPVDARCDLAVAGFDSLTPWWHLVYLAALACWFTCVGVLRHRRDRVVLVWLGGTSVVLAASVAIQFVVAQGYPAA